MGIKPLIQDVRYGLRLLVRRPGFAIAAVTTLALGIGANAAIFSVVNAVLLRQLPYPHPDRIVRITSRNAERGEQEWPSSYLDIQDWRQRSSSFEAVSAVTGSRSFNLVGENEAQRVTGELVESAYFDILGVSPALGRVFGSDEDQPGPAQLAIISYGLWVSRFGGRADVLEQTLNLDGKTYDVVGVAPRGFQGLTDEADIWLPMPRAAALYGSFYLEARPLRWLSALARLRPGVSEEEAADDLAAVSAGLAESHPDTNAGISTDVELLSESIFGDLTPRLLLLAGAAGFVLLIACTNVASLLLARGAGRRREVAIRAAMGAGRGRLVAQFLAEGAVLALAGCALGLAIAWLGTGALVRASTVDLPAFVTVRPDLSVALVMIGLAALAALLFSLAPAIAAARADLQGTLREGARGSSGASFGRANAQSVLVVAEIAVALVLFIAAGLIVKSFQQLQGQDLGFRARGLLTLRMDLKDERYAEDEAYRQFARQLLDGVRSTPGVRSAAVSGPAIPTDDWNSIHMTIEDRLSSGIDEPVVLPYHSVSPDYFRTAGLAFIEGRDFTPQEYDLSKSEGVAIVSESMARAQWPGESAINKRLKFGHGASGGPWFRVVGVVADAKHGGLQHEEERSTQDVYFSVYQVEPRIPPLLNLLVHTSADPTSLVPALTAQLGDLAPYTPFFDVRTMEERLYEQAGPARFLVLLFGLFAGLALLLAAVGIYGVIAYLVAQQLRELGIRMALGAGRAAVVGLVLRRGLRLTVLGVVLGVVGALALTRLLASLLYGVSPTDLSTFVGAALLLSAVALAAVAVPAGRAARVDPVRVLQAE